MDTNQIKQPLAAGSIISVRYPLYKHFAIVSDCSTNGKPDLISLSYRTGSVLEEPWDLVVGNKTYECSPIKGADPADIVIRRARSYIDSEISYNLLTFNCEHFVRLVHGLPMQSIQVQKTIYGAVIGATTCLFLPKLTIARFTLLVSIGAIASLKNSLNKL